MAEMRKKKKRRSPEGRFCHFNVHRLYRCRINDNQKLRPRKIEKKVLDSLQSTLQEFAEFYSVGMTKYRYYHILT